MAKKKPRNNIVKEKFEIDLLNTTNYRNFMRIALKYTDRICLIYRILLDESGFRKFIEGKQ